MNIRAGLTKPVPFHFPLRLFLRVWDVAVMIVEDRGQSHLQDPSLITKNIK